MSVSVSRAKSEPGIQLAKGVSRRPTRLRASRGKNSVRAAVDLLAVALDDHDAKLGGHGRRTADLASRMARALGLNPATVLETRRAALLHDIGKARVPLGILEKPGRLNADEWNVIRRHPETGAAMLSGARGLERVRRLVLTHHEWYDGRGYPKGLRAEEIPFGARLISVADAYDAMTNPRSYGRVLGHREAVEQLEEGAGTQFDPLMVEAAKFALEEIPNYASSLNFGASVSAR
ncbi:MAG: HD-GYP domain-containing protein [Rubrobacteraceae bacterium]